MKPLILFLLLFSIHNYAQNKEDVFYSSIITDINNYELEKADRKIKSISNLDCKILLQNEVNYLKTGLISNEILSLDTSNFDYYQKGIYYNFLGDYYTRISNKFSKKSYELYLKTYQLGVQNNNTSLQQESLRKMLNLFQINEMNFIQFSNISNEYSKLNNDFINTFWAKYYSIFKKYYEKTEYHKNNNFNIKSYDSLIAYCKGKPILKGKVYQMMSIYYSVTHHYKLSKVYIEKAKHEYKKSNEYYSQLALTSIEFNEGHDYLDTGNIKKATAVFRKSEQSKYFKQNLKGNILISDALYKTYSKAKNNDSAIYYLNRKIAFEDTLKREENSIAIHELDTKYHTREKDLAIKKLTNKQILLFALVGIVFIIALYGFFKWKKEDVRRKKLAVEKQYLETEHYQTIEELKTIKKLIEKDSIILKDKTKVNLEQLAYIKADDHYLSIHTIEKNNHFVRGKLSDIIVELPPNFIKCHRSYIINRNFVKQFTNKFVVMEDNTEIPISRNFRFEN